AVAASGIGVAHDLLEAVGHDLPGEPEAILAPAAGTFLAARGELRPVAVHLLLVLAVDDEGDGLVEGELRPAIEGGHLLAVEHEVDGEHHSRLSRSSLSVVGDGADLRVGEDRAVKLGGLQGLGVEPEHRADARHGSLLAHTGGGCLRMVTVQGLGNHRYMVAPRTASPMPVTAPRP